MRLPNKRNSDWRFGVVMFITLALLVALGMMAIPSASATATTTTPTPTALLPLSAQVGFSDPALTRLEATGFTKLNESREFDAYQHHYRLMTIWRDDNSVAPGGAALLYQIDGSVPILRWAQNYLTRIGQTPFISDIEAPPPGEWTHDGKVYFAVHGAFVGSAWYWSIYYAYEIHADGTVTSPFAENIPPGFIVLKIDSMNEQRWFVKALDVRNEMAMSFPNCCAPAISRYYEWRDNQLWNISSGFQNEYAQQLGTVIFALTTATIPNDLEPTAYAGNLLQLLMIYDAIGQRETGWRLAQQLVAQAKQQQSLVEGTYIDAVFMPTMQQLYESNADFVAPELQGKQYRDFYAEDR